MVGWERRGRGGRLRSLIFGDLGLGFPILRLACVG